MGEAWTIGELLGGEPPDRLDSEPLMNEQDGLTNVSAEKRAPRQARLWHGPEGERARGSAGGGNDVGSVRSGDARLSKGVGSLVAGDANMRTDFLDDAGGSADVESKVDDVSEHLKVLVAKGTIGAVEGGVELLEGGQAVRSDMEGAVARGVEDGPPDAS